MPKTFYIEQLGCFKNQVDAEYMITALQDKGYTRAVNAETAELILVNSCTFIESAKKESIEAFFALAVPGQLAKAKQEVGDSKIRKGRWIAQNTPCPPAVNDLYRQVVVALQG